jgi:hypothetical protein
MNKIKLETLSEEYTCKNRLIGRCKDCKRDYSDNHPNNLDCPSYEEVIIHVFNVQGGEGE